MVIIEVVTPSHHLKKWELLIFLIKLKKGFSYLRYGVKNQQTLEKGVRWRKNLNQNLKKRKDKGDETDHLVVPQGILASRGWVKEMELLRGISCIGVVVGHSIVYPHTTPLMDAVNQLITIVVPLFLFLSSFLAFYASPNETPYGYLKKQTLLVGLPYLFWVNVYIWIPVLTGKAQTPTFLNYLDKLVGGSFHLYFIPIVLQFYLVFTLNGCAWFRRLLYTPWVFVGSLGLMLGIQTLFSAQLRSLFPYFYLTFPAWCFYFVLGAWVARWWESIREWLMKSWRLIQLAVPFLMGLSVTRTLSQVASFQPLVQVAFLLILPFLLALATRIPKGTFLEPVARYSFGIYLIHRLPFNQFQDLYSTLSPYLFFVISMILQGGIGYGLTWILSRLSCLRWTVGMRIKLKKDRDS